MRFMVIVKASKESESGVLPSQEILEKMGKFNEELVKAGVMLAGEGLHPSSKGARVQFSGDKRKVVDGPFAETKELIAGFWLWQVKSKEEAIEWVKRCPKPTDGDSVIEIRQVFEAEDFGAEFTPELREQEKRLVAQIQSQTAAASAKTIARVPPLTSRNPATNTSPAALPASPARSMTRRAAAARPSGPRPAVASMNALTLA